LKALCAKGGSITGLAGSSAAVVLSAIDGKLPVIVVGDSLDDAGYLYFDLCRLVGDDAVAMLPSGFRRDIKYGQIDAPNQILRTEALARIASRSVRFVVTYPDALAECVASRSVLEDHTISLSLKKPMPMKDLIRWLRDNAFKEVDYVYEPGQFAVRGSVFDIFGYSAELPVRLDFFGDDIDSIRLFDVETQLSESRLDAIDVTANVSHTPDKQSLLDFIDPASIIALRSESITLERLRAIAEAGISAYTLLTEDGDADAADLIIDPETFAQRLAAFTRLSFTAAKPAQGTVGKTNLAFDCSPQGIYHKNFDLIAESFTRLLADGYRLCILSDNARQFDRLKEIFAERGDDISFEP
ncbi:MAG: transcription-repair coupling factor, partial [Muribaculaceae bacterium]|nr:transcription-repair coupling factor [Muribaculaceae bacterium]